MGAQDDFAFAQDFLADTGVETPSMLWDPNFTTWSTFGVSVNSQMIVLAPDLSTGTELFFGFSDSRQAEVLDLAAGLA